MIKFMYNVRKDIAILINQTVVNVSNPNKIIGYAEEGRMHNLQHASLFLVCEYNNINGTDLYQNPIAIVALNQTEANTLYGQITGKSNCSVLCELESNCKDLKVEPVS